MKINIKEKRKNEKTKHHQQRITSKKKLRRIDYDFKQANKQMKAKKYSKIPFEQTNKQTNIFINVLILVTHYDSYDFDEFIHFH